MTAFDTLHVLTPVYTPVGGVVKLMDYAQHARSLGLRVTVWCRQPLAEDEPLFRMQRFADMRDASDVSFVKGGWTMQMGSRDLALISLPRNYEVVRRSMPAHASPERVVHLVQNIRHVNPAWGAGYPTRLLTRPMARISINDIVADTIAPWLDPRAEHRVINLGHDTAFFEHADRSEHGGPLRVAYTTWKSDVGDRVAGRLAGDPAFEFRAVRSVATWEELRELYHWSDVFLSSPGPEEGFYLPGLEAMAAGSLVVTPDAGGNMAYCRPGVNCLLVEFEDPDSYVRALRRLATSSAAERHAMRTAARSTTEQFDLARERADLATFLGDLEQRVLATERSTSAG